MTAVFTPVLPTKPPSTGHCRPGRDSEQAPAERAGYEQPGQLFLCAPASGRSSAWPWRSPFLPREQEVASGGAGGGSHAVPGRPGQNLVREPSGAAGPSVLQAGPRRGPGGLPVGLPSGVLGTEADTVSCKERPLSSSDPRLTLSPPLPPRSSLSEQAAGPKARPRGRGWGPTGHPWAAGAPGRQADRARAGGRRCACRQQSPPGAPHSPTCHCPFRPEPPASALWTQTSQEGTALGLGSARKAWAPTPVCQTNIVKHHFLVKKTKARPETPRPQVRGAHTWPFGGSPPGPAPGISPQGHSLVL